MEGVSNYGTENTTGVCDVYLVYHTNWNVMDGVTRSQGLENFQNDSMIGTEVCDGLSEIFFPGVSQKIQFGLVCPQHDSFRTQPWGK